MPEALAYADHSPLLETLGHIDPSIKNRVAKFLKIQAHFEEVVEVKTFKTKETVYDITVPEGHAFYANGLTSHNTRIFAVIDELGLFPLPRGDAEEDEQSSRANSDEAHKSLTNSLTTVQAISIDLLAKGINAPPALMLGVSSPMSHRDKVMRLLNDSKSEEGSKYILGVNLPTWKVNPSIHRNTPIIALAYSRNPEKAERDFGANPPTFHSAFVGKGSIKHSLFQEKPSHRLIYQYDRPGMLYAKVEKLRAIKHPCLVCLDAGSVNNSFSLSACYYDEKENCVHVPTLLECMPHDGRAINFTLLYQNLILPVAKDLNAVAILADQWQSLDLLHRATEDMGLLTDGKPRCLSKQYSPRRKDFDFLVSLLNNESILLPFLEIANFTEIMEGSVVDFRLLNGKPAQHLLLQMLTVREGGTGKCPIKGEGFTDDLWRTLVLCTKLFEPKVMERIKNAKLLDADLGAKSKMPMPVFLGRSGFRVS
jgi:hypothetical protein